jgi:hypothetical protein
MNSDSQTPLPQPTSTTEAGLTASMTIGTMREAELRDRLAIVVKNRSS